MIAEVIACFVPGCFVQVICVVSLFVFRLKSSCILAEAVCLSNVAMHLAEITSCVQCNSAYLAAVHILII